MGKLVVTEFITLDGVFEDPGGSEHKEYGGWQIPLMGDDEGVYKFEELKGAGALLLGRVTYEGFAAAWPTMKDTGEFGELMNGLPKYVATLSMSESLVWNNSKPLGTDLEADVERLKNEFEKDILVMGSGQLVRALLQAKLVDEVKLMTYPLVLGQGKRLFDDAEQTKFKFLATREFQRGTVLLTYAPVG
jgi:dihydrofolate reductase